MAHGFQNIVNLVLLAELEHIAERNRMRIARRRIRDTSNPFEMSNKDFIKFFRLSKVWSKDLTRYLVQTLRPHLEQVAIQHRRTRIPLEFKILTVLNFFAQGSYQCCVGHNFSLGISQPSVSEILNSVTEAMVDHLLNICIVFPRTDAATDRIKQRFREKYNFPGIIGAIDCSHIAIISPCEDDPVRPALAYYNRKGYYSINAQMICDADLRILNCNVRFPGSVHDSAIWTLSSVKQYLMQKFIQGELNSSWLIGDSGYGLQPWLLTPIENADPNTAEGRYTARHMSARNCIERCFGVLKQRFRCLLKHRTLHYHPVKAGRIILCCAILHNMILAHQVQQEEYEPMEDYIDGEDAIRDDLRNADNREWLAQGRRVQQNLINHHF